MLSLLLSLAEGKPGEERSKGGRQKEAKKIKEARIAEKLREDHVFF